MIRLFKIGCHSFRDFEKVKEAQNEATTQGVKTFEEFIKFLDNRR
jgi:hypothetical protein